MSQRSEDLSKRIQAFRDDVIAYVESMNSKDWNAVCEWEEWTAGVTARHMGAGHFRIFEILGMILDGKDLPQLTMDQINAMSDRTPGSIRTAPKPKRWSSCRKTAPNWLNS